MPRLPRKIPGSSAYAMEFNAVVDYLVSLRPATSVGTLTEHNTFGVIRRGNAKVAPGKQSGGSASRFRVKSVQGDYLTCHTLEGTTEGSTDIYIAKQPDLRHSLTAQTVNSVSVTFDTFSISGGVCLRTAKATGYPNQIEMVIPQYQIAGTGPDSEIWADEPSGGTGVTKDGTALTWMSRDSRAWCQIG